MSVAKKDPVFGGVSSEKSNQGGYTFEKLKIGDMYKKSVFVTEGLLTLFGRISGDWQPIHFDDAYAKETIFKGRVVHGMLVESFFSGMIGMGFPGPGCILLEKHMVFKRPVRIGDVVELCVTVTELAEKESGGVVCLKATCEVGGKTALHGEIKLFVPKRKVP